MKITQIKSIEILDSRGNPTLRTFITLEDGSVHSSSVPSGASTGSHEAKELRDGNKKRYMGLGVKKAVENVNTIISKKITGMGTDPNLVDDVMLELDGTQNKGNLGANAILSVSIAMVKAASHSQNLPLWKFLNSYYFDSQPVGFPLLMVNVINGGKHASWNFDIQEFMIVPNAAKPSESVRIASEIFHSIGKILKEKGLSTLVGDEGGYSPARLASESVAGRPILNSNEEVFDIIISSAKKAGYENVKDFRISIDAASTEFFKEGKYHLKKSNQTLSSDQLTKYYQKIGIKNFILSFEDAFAEDDWDAHIKFTEMALKFKFETIGDDLFATNTDRIKKGIKEKAATGVLIKPNQIGTVKETAQAINMAHAAPARHASQLAGVAGRGLKTVISHRSGDTEDSFIADLAYACGSEYIKAGSMSRSERLSKYNRLLEIEAGL